MELITIDLNHLLLIVMLILFVTAGKGIYDMIKWEKSHGTPEGWNEYLKVKRLAGSFIDNINIIIRYSHWS